MVLHDRVDLHPALFLAGLRMSPHTFEYVVKECYRGGIHHVEELLPVFRLVCLPLVALGRAAVR